MPLPPTITDNVTTPAIQLTWAPQYTYYGYCTVADVEYEFPDQSLYTTLTPSVVAQEITNAGQELQNTLANLYQMPYSGSDGGILLTLRNINAKLATANLIDRYFQGSEPNLSPAAAERRSWAELILTDVINGTLQWGTPFGDAVALSEKPVYPLSAGATVLPDPNSLDPNTANPIFSMGRTRFSRGRVM